MLKLLTYLLLIFILTSCFSESKDEIVMEEGSGTILIDNNEDSNQTVNEELSYEDSNQTVNEELSYEEIINNETIKEELNYIDSNLEEGYKIIVKNFSEDNYTSKYVNVIRVSLDLGKYDEVNKYWKLINTNMDITSIINIDEIISDVIQSYVLQGKFDDGEKLIKLYGEKYPNININQGFLYYHKGLYKETIQFFKSLGNVSQLKSSFFIGKSYYNLSDFKNSELFYLELLSNSKNTEGTKGYVYNYLALNGLVEVYKTSGNTDKLTEYQQEINTLNSIILKDDTGLIINKDDIQRIVRLYFN